MDNVKIAKILGIVIGAVVAVLGLFLPMDITVTDVAEKAIERIGVLCATESGNCVESWNGSDIIVYSDAGSSQTLSLDGATGDINSEGDLNLADWMTIEVQTAISVTAGAIITPTGTYQPLTSAAAVTTSTSAAIQNGTTDGQLLILRNDNAADTITIDGTGGNVECKADVVLGAEDTLTLIWNSADWVCLSGYDNS